MFLGWHSQSNGLKDIHWCVFALLFNVVHICNIPFSSSSHLG
nr:MAG TPA: hypothetical protein [Caudoviricetes sp.]